MPLTTYGAQKLIGYLLGNVSYAPPATIYVALFTSVPSNTGGGTEVSGGSYARFAATNNSSFWTGATSTYPTVISNAQNFSFTSSTADWNTVGWIGIYDALSGGNLLWWGVLSTAVDVPSGNVYQFPTGTLQFTLG